MVRLGGGHNLWPVVASIVVVVSSLTAGVGVSVASQPESTVPTGQSAGPPDDGATGSIDDLDLDRSPVILKGEVLKLIDELDAPDRPSERLRARAHARVNGTAVHYRGFERVLSAEVFRNDSAAIRDLATITERTGQENATRAIRLLVAADNRTAATTIADARRALANHEAEIDNPGQRRSVRKHVENAQRAFDRAQRRLSRTGGDQSAAYRERAAAVGDMATAWHQAQLALWKVDRLTGPSVRIEHRADRVRNGSHTQAYPVVANVTEVRPWTIDNATILVDGQPTGEVPIRTFGVGPDENASVATVVNPTDRVNNVTVVVTDRPSERPTEPAVPGTREGGRQAGNGGEGGPPEKAGSGNGNDATGGGPAKASTERGPGSSNGPGIGPALHDPQRATASLFLDGDGLTDRHEQTVLAMDPLDPDSDAATTPADEADDGTIDGHEDLDDDGLTNLRELEHGTKSLNPDTDGDGLRDGDEVLIAGAEPLNPDTDGDGVLDGDEDFDEDGLTNVEEMDFGSDPHRADTDFDGLEDAEEQAQDTNPRNLDTDRDFLLDGEEVREPFNTDPLDPDSDGDGILDGNETYTTTATNESTGGSFAVTAEGNGAAGVSIEPDTRHVFDNELLDNASASATVRLEARGSLPDGNLTVEYHEAAVQGDESNLTIFRFNRSTQLFDVVDSTVDAASDEVTAPVDEPGTYVVMTPGGWFGQFPSPEEERRGQRLEAVEAHASNCTGICGTDNGTIAVGVLAADDTFEQLSHALPAAGSTVSTLATLGQQTVEATSSPWYGRSLEIRMLADDSEPDIEANVSEGTPVELRSYMNGTVTLTAGNETITAESETTQASLQGGHGYESLFASGDVQRLDDTEDKPTATVTEVDVSDSDTLQVSGELSGDGSVLVNGEPVESVEGSSTSFTDSVDVSGADSVTLEIQTELGKGIALDGWDVTAFSSGDVSVGPLPGNRVTTDLCHAAEGKQSFECPDSAVDAFTFTVQQETLYELQFEFVGTATVDIDGSTAGVEVVGPDRTESFVETSTGTHTIHETVTFEDLAAGDEATVRLEATGVAKMELDALVFRKDSDGDGFYDLEETQCSWHILLGCITSDPHDVDTDGDRLRDDEELTRRIVDTPLGKKVIYFASSHPDEEFTDQDSFNDSEEYQPKHIPYIQNETGDPQRWDHTCDSDPTPFGFGPCDGWLDATSDPLWTDTDLDELNDDTEVNVTKTDPGNRTTYNITNGHQKFLNNLLSGGSNDQDVSPGARIISGQADVRESALTDATDDFDFVMDDTATDPLDKLTFSMLDDPAGDASYERTDRWFSNEEEVRFNEDPASFGYDDPKGGEVDVWDPDTDDDGLTDGQEVFGLTIEHSTLLKHEIVTDQKHTYNTSPVVPDTDGDGYWDGWVGVYNASYSDNVILYAEHLLDADDTLKQDGEILRGIRGDERVDDQTGVHEVTNDPMTASATNTSLPGKPGQYHSKIHVGELTWRTSPLDDSPAEIPETDLDVEVDWLNESPKKNYNPYQMVDSATGKNVLESVRQNYLLYDINVEFFRSDPVESHKLRFICKIEGSGGRPIPRSDPCVERFSPESLNAYELNIIKEEYHDDDSRVHLFWASEYNDEDVPEWTPHDFFIPENVAGGAGHTGSPGHVALIEELGRVPYGVVIFDEKQSDFEERKMVLMHELGHTLSLGWADDKGSGHIAECYSGDFCWEAAFGTLYGGDDLTTEFANANGVSEEWSIMSTKQGIEILDLNRLAFSIEEISTIDLKEIPTIDD